MTITISNKGAVQDRYKIFLSLIAAFYNFKITGKQAEVLNEFYWRSGGLITKESRKEVCAALEMSDFNLNNYLKKLRDMGLVDKDTDSIAANLIVNVAPSERAFGVLFVLEN